jgi:hypothetical protein
MFPLYVKVRCHNGGVSMDLGVANIGQTHSELG